MEQENQLLLSWISTTWPKVLQGRGQEDGAAKARAELLVRYHEAVYHYFLQQLRDPHVAQELYSNFALRLIETDQIIKRADPKLGRFRNYLKTILHHMVIDYYRSRGRKKEQPLPLDVSIPDVIAQESGDPDTDFPPIWRQELLNQAWKGLEEQEKKSGHLYYTALRYQSDHADQRAPQIAEALSKRCRKSFTPEAIRQVLHRAREKFAQLLLEEVERSMETPGVDELEQELIDLQLLVYCKKALEKRRGVKPV
jgi:RNA polymerase sigma-70 factor (ECF subfamily)